MRRVQLTGSQWTEACVALHALGARYARFVMHDDELGLVDLTEPDLDRLRRIHSALDAMHDAEYVAGVSNAS